MQTKSRHMQHQHQPKHNNDHWHNSLEHPVRLVCRQALLPPTSGLCVDPIRGLEYTHKGSERNTTKSEKNKCLAVHGLAHVSNVLSGWNVCVCECGFDSLFRVNGEFTIQYIFICQRFVYLLFTSRYYRLFEYSCNRIG